MPDRAIYLLAGPEAENFASSKPDTASPTMLDSPVDGPGQGPGAEAPIPVPATDGRVGIPDEPPGSMGPVARHPARTTRTLALVSREGRNTRPQRLEAEATVGRAKQTPSVAAITPRSFVARFKASFVLADAPVV